MCSAAFGSNDSDLRAAEERAVVDPDDAAGEYDLLKRRAAFKGRIRDFSDAVGNGDLCKDCAVEERIATDGGDAFRKGNADGRFIAVCHGESALSGVVLVGHEGDQRILRTGKGIAVIG